MFSRIPNQRIHDFFFTKFSFFLLKPGRIFLSRLKNAAKTIYFYKKTLCSSFIRKRHFSWRKILLFVDSEFVEICHEKVIYYIDKLHRFLQPYFHMNITFNILEYSVFSECIQSRVNQLPH